MLTNQTVLTKTTLIITAIFATTTAATHRWRAFLDTDVAILTTRSPKRTWSDYLNQDGYLKPGRQYRHSFHSQCHYYHSLASDALPL
jgi:hypothetical protein